MNIKLFIEGKSTAVYQPVVEEGIEWSTERIGVPGKLVFKIRKDDILNFSEGSIVKLQVKDKDIFYGFVFKQSKDKDNIITITAYDQLRYLKNKDVYIYENKTASDFIKMIAADFTLKLGVIEDTGFIIPTRVETNQSLLDMIGSALDLTLTNKKEMFVLYDDFGKLTLKNISNMHVGTAGAYLVIDEESGENFDYTSSIDDNTYNKIKLTYENEETGRRDVYIANDFPNMKSWGVLQYHEALQKNENGQAKADALLSLYNKKTRNLRITNVFGDIRVRAGSMIAVNLKLGDTAVKNFMLVERCKHIFKESEHWMDLTLRGGEFIA